MKNEQEFSGSPHFEIGELGDGIFSDRGPTCREGNLQMPIDYVKTCQDIVNKNGQ